MSAEAVNARNAPSERVIDACVELLDAGRPVSEILKELRRLSEEDLTRLGPDASEDQAAISRTTLRIIRIGARCWDERDFCQKIG